MPPQSTTLHTKPSVLHSQQAYKVAVGVLLIAVIILGTVLANGAISRPSGTRYSIAGTHGSSNWSVFEVVGAPFSMTAVKASWTVPVTTCDYTSTLNQLVAVWVGIDGALNSTGSSKTIEQAGTLSGCITAEGVLRPISIGWFEWYPSPLYPYSQYRSLPAGDTVSVEEKWDGDHFTATIFDQTQDFRVIETNSTIGSIAQRSSAEWIVEAPFNIKTTSLDSLANFDKVFFSGCYATVNGATSPLGAMSSQQVTMEEAGRVKAQPVLPFWNDGTSFSVWWQSK